MAKVIVKAATSYEDVPPGVYTATFDGITQIETSKGEALRWAFTVTEGPHVGRTISELSDAGDPTVKNKRGRFLCALAGKPLKPDTEVDPDQHIGKPYMVACEAREDGKTKVSMFTPKG